MYLKTNMMENNQTNKGRILTTLYATVETDRLYSNENFYILVKVEFPSVTSKLHFCSFQVKLYQVFLQIR